MKEGINTMGSGRRVSDRTYAFEGHFHAKAFDHKRNEEIYNFNKDNKIVLGARELIPRLLGAKTQGYTPVSDELGLTKFILFSIDNTVETPPCADMMLTGDFGQYYEDLEPVRRTEINTTSFPCLSEIDILEVSHVPSSSCLTTGIPGPNESFFASDIIDNSITFCAKIGVGHAAPGQVKYYAMAALVGRSPDPNDTSEYIYAMQQMPVMVLTDAISMSFSWKIYI